MKHYFSHILVVLVCFILPCCTEKSNEVVITGQLEGVEEGTVIKLMKPEGNLIVDFQVDTVKNGCFYFSFIDSLDVSKQMNIMADGEGFPPTWLDIWVTPGANIKITGKDKLIRSWNVSSNVPEQNELNKYNERVKHYENISQANMRDAYAYFDEIDKSPDNIPELRAKIDSLYAIDDSIAMLRLKEEINLMDENRTYSLVWMGKLSRYATALKFIEIPGEYVGKLKDMYDSMSEVLKNSEEGQVILINLFPPAIVQVGEDMADADMWNLEGELCHLSDYKGKYLLLDFWSAGCGPCIAAIPEMKEISEMYKDQLWIISISSDPKDPWTQTSKEKDISWINLNDFKGENGIKLRYGVRGIPHYVIITPEGKMMTQWSGYGKGLLKQKMGDILKNEDV